MLKVLVAAVFILLAAVVSLQLMQGKTTPSPTGAAGPGQAAPAQAEQAATARVTSGIAAAQQRAQDHRTQADVP